MAASLNRPPIQCLPIFKFSNSLILKLSPYLHFQIFKLKKIFAAGGLVKNEQGELLMIFRRGKWDLPKGKLDEGESIAECAIREVKEETGLQTLQLEELAGITHHQYFDTWIGEEVIKETHWFHMLAPGTQTLIPQTEEDIQHIQWTNPLQRQEYLKESYPNIVQIVGKLTF